MSIIYQTTGNALAEFSEKMMDEHSQKSSDNQKTPFWKKITMASQDANLSSNILPGARAEYLWNWPFGCPRVYIIMPGKEHSGDITQGSQQVVLEAIHPYFRRLRRLLGNDRSIKLDAVELETTKMVLEKEEWKKDEIMKLEKFLDASLDKYVENSVESLPYDQLFESIRSYIGECSGKSDQISRGVRDREAFQGIRNFPFGIDHELYGELFDLERGMVPSYLEKFKEESFLSELQMPFTVVGQIVSGLATALSKNSVTEMSRNAKYLLQFGTGCSYITFIAWLYIILLRLSRSRGIAARIMKGIATTATTYGVLAVMGMFLPDEYMLWGTAGACLISSPAFIGYAIKQEN